MELAVAPYCRLVGDAADQFLVLFQDFVRDFQIFRAEWELAAKLLGRDDLTVGDLDHAAQAGLVQVAAETRVCPRR